MQKKDIMTVCNLVSVKVTWKRMRKNNVETNSLSSYIFIDGYELYVIYLSQAITCKKKKKTAIKRKSDFSNYKRIA